MKQRTTHVGIIQPRLHEAEHLGMARMDITTTALIECERCRREVEAHHADCDACWEEAPDASPLERCEHYVCRRCGQEL